MQTTINDNALFDLGGLTNYLFTKWKWFLIFGFGFAIIFAIISSYLPNKYTAETSLVAAESAMGAMDGLNSQLGGLASFAGLNLNSGKDKTVLALQILKSRQFLISFVKKNHLEQALFAVSSWDAKQDEYLYNQEKYNISTNKWLPRSDQPGTYYPTDLEIFEEMNSLIAVQVDKANQVTKVMLTYYNPAKAQQWLTLLIDTLNNTMRINDIKEKEDQITFLQQQLNLEKNNEIRNVFYALIEEQLKSSTLAKARKEYVFRIIDPALFPEEKSSPKRALNTVLGGLVGGVFCFIFFALRFIFRSK